MYSENIAIEPFGGTQHFLIHLKCDTGNEDSDKTWFGDVETEKGRFAIYKRNLFFNSGNRVEGELDITCPESVIQMKFNCSNWNDLSSIILSFGLAIAGGGIVAEGLGLFGLLGLC